MLYVEGMKIKKYSIIHLPLFSFFSKKLYRDVGQNWKGANFSYLFLLLAICWIPPTLNLRESLVESLDSNQLQIINQIPEIHIKNGQTRDQVGITVPVYIARAAHRTTECMKFIVTIKGI